jgi:uncharacterized SAM-binding protein YcdF (DUF218 family)
LRKRFFVAILGMVPATLLAVYAGAAAGIYAYAQRSEVAQADAAIVLGAAAFGTEPSPVFQARIDHAVDLYRQGLVRTLVFTGGRGEPGEPPEAVVAREYALARGVPPADILVETESRITEQNLLYARQVAADHGLRRFLIVSDPLHMKRAILMARDLGMDAHPAPTPTTRYRSARSQLAFLARETFFYLGYLVARPFRTPVPPSSRSAGETLETDSHRACSPDIVPCLASRRRCLVSRLLQAARDGDAGGHAHSVFC